MSFKGRSTPPRTSRPDLDHGHGIRNLTGSRRLRQRDRLLLALLLGLPAAVIVQQWDNHVVRAWTAVAVGATCISFFAMRSDKQRAQAGGWRLSESFLHTLETLGGWPGSFVAQRRYRHKTAKLSYQLTFWVIVALYQYAALDSLAGWKITEAITRVIT